MSPKQDPPCSQSQEHVIPVGDPPGLVPDHVEAALHRQLFIRFQSRATLEDTESRIVGPRGMYARRINRVISEDVLACQGPRCYYRGSFNFEWETLTAASMLASVRRWRGGLFRDSDVIDVM
jgi:hypothetical protein